MVSYYYDSNCILGVLLKDRRGITIVEVWVSIHKNFNKLEAALTSYILDNEISSNLVQVFNKEIITY